MEQNLSLDDRQVYGNRAFHMATNEAMKLKYSAWQQPSLWNQDVSHNIEKAHTIKVIYITTTESVESGYFKWRQPSLRNESFHKTTNKSMKNRIFQKKW